MEIKTTIDIWNEYDYTGENEKWINTKWVRVDNIINFLNNLDLEKYDSYTIMYLSNKLLEMQDAKNN